MSTSTVAGLRFPLSLGFGLLVTASMFWALWSLTTTVFVYEGTEAVPLDWGRQVPETLTTPRDRTRPDPIERPPVEDLADVIKITEIIPTEVDRQKPRMPWVASTGEGTGQRVSDIPFTLGSDRDATPTVRIEPTYPPRAQAQGIEGWVRVQFNVSATGAVTDVTVVDGEPRSTFDSAAAAAVARWRYNPRVVEGMAVERVGMQTVIRFTLEDE